MTRRRRWIISVGVVVVLALVISTLVRVYAVDIYTVNQESMEPTLQDGERVLVAKSYPEEDEPARGDIVIFDGEGSFTPYRGEPSLERVLERAGHWIGIGSPPDVYVKRVIGIGGDRIVCCDDQGQMSVNGEPLDEDYLAESPTPDTPASDLSFEAEVPEGRIWVMGDNREDSVDSRALLGAPGGGMISQERIIGEVSQVVWPRGDRRDIEGGMQ